MGPVTAARPRPGAHSRDALFIDGGWRPARGRAAIPVHDCGTEEELGRIASAGLEDVDVAVVAANDALPEWRGLAPNARADALLSLHAELDKRSEELASLISAEVGTAIRLCAQIQVKSALEQLSLTAQLLREHRFEEEVGNSVVVHEAVGVVAAITPWNYPLFQAMAKVAPALAAGCTVVHKPSGLAPLSAFVLADAAARAGLPPGTYNLVAGPGTSIGEALVGNDHVDMVSFTGSTEAGARVYEIAARSIKRVALELGGKSASVLLDDAAVEAAVKASVNRAFLNSGQTCDAWTRLLVPESLLGDALEVAVATTQRLTLGDQFDERTKLGPLISASQVERVRGYLEGAIRQGAEVVIGGASRPESLARGHFVRPTVLRGVTADMTVARDEVFGPVLAVMTYKSEAEALAIANGTEYGLSGAVWSADPSRARAFALRMRSGQVVVNGGRFNPLAPAGGMKKSGIGRELGRYGMQEFLEPKALQL
jgi:acyl-CoA reductase-like NAD-dependent aldehyde dehydrogenase